MKNLLILILFFYLSFESNAYKNYSNNDFKEIIKNLKYRNVGPTRGGRVTSVHGVDSQKNIFYIIIAKVINILVFKKFCP